MFLHTTVLLLFTTQALAAVPNILSFYPDRQFHAADLHLPDVVIEQLPSSTATSYAVKARPTTVYRPSSPAAVQQARLRSLHLAQNEPVEWIETHTVGPDVEDRHTLVQLARMTANAYSLPGSKGWYDIDPAWNQSFPVGWQDVEDGFRGHVFLSSDNSTVILSIKGTALKGSTSRMDKYNDNLLFSCCCAYVDFSWVFSQVCDCHTKGWKCDSTCLSEALIQDSLFYSVGIDLIHNLTSVYPSANIWLVGHSLGGALASLLGATFGFPAVAFQSPGDRVAAKRLHLPLPPPDPASTNGLPLVPVTHVYNNADPIAKGTCNGFGSICASAGYALETGCHLGKSIVYDTIGRLGWRVDITRHRISIVIDEVLEVDSRAEGWEWEEGRVVPRPKAEGDCVDCFKWEFGNYRDNSLFP